MLGAPRGWKVGSEDGALLYVNQISHAVHWEKIRRGCEESVLLEDVLFIISYNCFSWESEQKIQRLDLVHSLDPCMQVVPSVTIPSYCSRRPRLHAQALPLQSSCLRLQGPPSDSSRSHPWQSGHLAPKPSRLHRKPAVERS